MAVVHVESQGRREIARAIVLVGATRLMQRTSGKRSRARLSNPTGPGDGGKADSLQPSEERLTLQLSSNSPTPRYLGGAYAESLQHKAHLRGLHLCSSLIFR